MVLDGVSLNEILAAKERRMSRQRAMRLCYGTPLVSITLNIPGPRKDSPLLRRLRDYAVFELKRRLSICAIEFYDGLTGPEAIVAVDASGAAAKAASVAVEEASDFGRLLDMDVFDEQGIQVSRRDQGIGRKCLVCNQQAVICMRERSHSREELEKRVNELLYSFRAFITRDLSPKAEKIGVLAVEAMLYEVACTPAPGLVDRVNNGAHQDMDFFSFMSSSSALGFILARCAQAGIDHAGSLSELLPVLRIIGSEGEKGMLKATGGVNTQKGLLFSLGITAAAAGWLVKSGDGMSAGAIAETVAQITAGIVERELASIEAKAEAEMTAGEKLFRHYGITGIRGEMEQGLPCVINKALPQLRKALAAGMPVNDALVHTLLVLMTCVDDTTVMNRHNPDKMRVWVKTKAAAALTAGGMYTAEGKRMVCELDKEFISQNVSPGGSADLLAVAWFIHCLETKAIC